MNSCEINMVSINTEPNYEKKLGLLRQYVIHLECGCIRLYNVPIILKKNISDMMIYQKILILN